MSGSEECIYTIALRIGWQWAGYNIAGASGASPTVGHYNSSYKWYVYQLGSVQIIVSIPTLFFLVNLRFSFSNPENFVGGGLISGVALAAKSINPAIRILAAEPMGANDAAQSKAAGRIITLPETNTIADGLRAFLGDLTW